MSASLEQVDLAANLAALAKVLDNVLLPKMRDYASGLITEWSTPEKADALAAVLEETARQVRLNRPSPRSDVPVESKQEEETCPPSTTWSNAPVATAVASTHPAASPTVSGVEELAKSPGSDCPDCEGTGVMRWQQPEPDGSGGMILRDMEHPCIRGCGGHWKQPAAERHLVVDTPSDAPQKIQGQAAAANRMPPVLANEIRQAYAKYSRE